MELRFELYCVEIYAVSVNENAFEDSIEGAPSV